MTSLTGVMKKITLLLIVVPSSLLVSLLTSSMMQIMQEYPQYSESAVTMILTVPNLSIMIGLVLSPILVKKYSIKKLVLTGLCIFTASNVAGYWCHNFYLLLFLRALSGAGCGLIMPLQATFLAVYPEKERATLLGLGATIGCLTAAVLVIISGMIAEIYWRYVFFLYLINVVGIIMAVVFLPEHLERPETSQPGKQQPKAEQTQSLADYKKELAFFFCC